MLDFVINAPVHTTALMAKYRMAATRADSNGFPSDDVGVGEACIRRTREGCLASVTDVIWVRQGREE